MISRSIKVIILRNMIYSWINNLIYLKSFVLLYMGRKSKYQLRLQHKQTNLIEEKSSNKKNIPKNNSHKNYRRNHYKSPSRTLLKIPIKEDPRDFAPIDIPQLLNDYPLEFFSAEKIAYNLFINKDETARIIKTYTKKPEEIQEEKLIKNAKTTDELIAILLRKPAPINHELLIEKMLKKESEIIPRILPLLKKEIDDHILEFIIDLLYQTKDHWISEIETIISSITFPYTISLLSLILGMNGNTKKIPLLWKAFHILNENYSYTQGALLGLSLTWDKEHGISID